ncbi:MAG: PBSX family phage terminase large subunit [Anaerolineales bacterium]|nr:PBSX family phage terminase large subunit [Anaerolineales bacterium]
MGNSGKRESNKALRAFEDYFNLGPDRSLAKLVQIYGKARAGAPTRHISTLEKWSSDFRWQERVREREAQIAAAQLDAIKENAPKTGYAVYQKRINDLNALAEKLYESISDEDKLFLPDPRWVGGFTDGERVDRVKFNQPLVTAYLDTLDDIAEEMGERKTVPEPPVPTSPIAAGLPAHLLAPSFLEPYRDIRAARHTEYVFIGGRGSIKSSSVSLFDLDLLLANPNMHVLVMRQFANTMRDSVFSQLQWAISELGLDDRFRSIRSPLEMEYLPTGQKIYFRGADEPGKLKSIKPAFGYIGILHLEELDQFKGEDAVRNIEQSAIRGGDLAYRFKVYNSPRSANAWVNKWVRVPDPRRLVHRSSYLDAPADWLGQAFIDMAEHLKEVNPKAYEHEYLGEVNGTGGMVFENVIADKPITDEQIAQFDRPLQGLDWGWFPDPLHFAKMHYDAARMTLYIYGEYRAHKTPNKQVMDALVLKHLLSLDALVIADSASPKDIADFRSFGVNIRGAEKGPDSVTYSIKWLQSLAKIVIDPVRCPQTAEEFLNYELERDKEGNFISSYPDKNNHAIDAVRYATNLIWRRGGE